MIDFETWSSTLTSDMKEFILNELDYIEKKLPKLLEKEFMPLFELGIDIGVASNGSIWILDVNSKPGRKVILETAPDLKETLYLAPLTYGKQLSRSDPKERKKYYERTLSD